MRVTEAYEARKPLFPSTSVGKTKVGLKQQMKAATTIDELLNLSGESKGYTAACTKTQNKWEKVFNLRYAQLNGEVKP
jgi:hypothetical protein